MDYKTILDRIEWNENRLRKAQDEFIELKDKITALILLEKENRIENDIIKMFDEKYRLSTALKLCDHKRRKAAKLCQMSERNFYRLLKKYNPI